MGHAESYMTETISMWQNNVLILLSTRNITVSNSNGTFALLVIVLIALIALLSEFKHFINKRLTDKRTERIGVRVLGLTRLVCQILDKLLLYLVFTIAQDIRRWDDGIFVDGTLTPREPLTIVCIFLSIFLVYYDFTGGQAFEPELLGKVENYLTELNHISNPDVSH